MADASLDASRDTGSTTTSGQSPPESNPAQDNETTQPPQPCVQERHWDDQKDDETGHQLRLLYILPSDGMDRSLDIDGTLWTSANSFNDWLGEHTGGSKFRLDTCDGKPDIGFLRLQSSDEQIHAQDPYIRDRIDDAVFATGLGAWDKVYLAYYDGASGYSCGGGAYPPTLIGRVAALYLHGEPPGAPTCDSMGFAAAGQPPGYLEFAMLHEVLHTIGVVATCAPHHQNAGHVDDSPDDLMWQGNAPWNPTELDVGHDDYYMANHPGCPDLARSVFLEPRPAAAESPPGWPA